jgi:hypothetical protein
MLFSREVSYRLNNGKMGMTFYTVGRPPNGSGFFAIDRAGGHEKGIGFQIHLFGYDVGFSVWKKMDSSRFGGTLLLIDLDSLPSETTVGSYSKIVN